MTNRQIKKLAKAAYKAAAKAYVKDAFGADVYNTTWNDLTKSEQKEVAAHTAAILNIAITVELDC